LEDFSRVFTLRELMRIFKAETVLKLVHTLVNVATISPDDKAPIPPGWREQAAKAFTELLVETKSLGLNVAPKQISDALAILSQPPVRETGAMGRLVNMVATTIETELSIRLFFFIPPDRADFYNATEPFGAEVTATFPDAQFDLEEAAKCFALERWTACVIHLMRAVEVGLAAFAKELGAPLGTGNWQDTLTSINREINKLESTKPTPDWKDRVEKYSAVSSHIRDIKTAVRNPSMHVRGRYDEVRARDIYNATGAFLRHLATSVLI
jgi:hypothetical protein